MRAIGIDYGEARIGVATGDSDFKLASSLCTLKIKSLSDGIEQVSAKIKELNSGLLIIGMPKNMDGTNSNRENVTRLFAQGVQEKTGLAPIFVDERLTTMQAQQYLNLSGCKKTKKKNVIDALSAQIILQNYFDSLK